MDIEKEIKEKNLNAPRVTPDMIDEAIVAEYYFSAADGFAGALVLSEEFNNLPDEQRIVEPPEALELLTFCVLVLKNGFTVTGESACASPENFDADIGKKVARANAVSKIWPLEGYLLKQRLSEM